jgi:hypothetical protein
VKKLWELLAAGAILKLAALKSGMTEKTARRYRELSRLPSEVEVEHTWRTREDPFEEVWPKVAEQLRLNPGLQAKTLFEWLKKEHPNQFHDGQLRTLQRRIKHWRATEGPGKEVFFSQVHYPGDLGASDFTHMSSLGVTIARQPFDHLAYHFVLTYSNWEAISVCHSESFESLSDGLQSALWKLGGVPRRHRTDRMSAAVNNLSDTREFTTRYDGLMNHYKLNKEKIQARKAHENGDVESLHCGFKTAVDQALLLRGSRDFASVEDYQRFLQELVDGRNSARSKRLAEEWQVLRPLPSRRLEGFRKFKASVNTGSVIRVLSNTYSVHSRLVGEEVEVRVFADHLEVWYAQKRVDRFPRLRGRGRHRINYRHVIDWLVRKPGAFTNYRYRDDLFPTSRFRMAYDALCERRSADAAVKDYLVILELAAYESESRVDEALHGLLNSDTPWTLEQLREQVCAATTVSSVTEVHVCEVDLSTFDGLLDDVSFFENTEVFDDCHGCEIDFDRTFAGVASANVS